MAQEKDFKVTVGDDDLYVRLSKDGDLVTISDHEKNPADLEEEEVEEAHELAVEQAETEGWIGEEDEEEETEEAEAESEKT
jgi:hypothetical protein